MLKLDFTLHAHRDLYPGVKASFSHAFHIVAITEKELQSQLRSAQNYLRFCDWGEWQVVIVPFRSEEFWKYDHPNDPPVKATLVRLLSKTTFLEAIEQFKNSAKHVERCHRRLICPPKIILKRTPHAKNPHNLYPVG